jgi:hypothetical protein
VDLKHALGIPTVPKQAIATQKESVTNALSDPPINATLDHHANVQETAQ